MATRTETPATPDGRPDHRLEDRISDVGLALGDSLSHLLDSLPGGANGPADLARRLDIDKVLASRVIKAARNRDPIAVIYHSPGPEPLRRMIKATGRARIDRSLLDNAEKAVEDFENLIRIDVGDRGSLDAIISAWLPEARQEFELRRKQSAFKAMSQLKGAMCETNLVTAFLHPNKDAHHVDVVWLSGLFNLQRLRPDAAVKITTRHLPTANPVESDQQRQPTSLDGRAIEAPEDVRLDPFCSAPPPALRMLVAGHAVHYMLADQGYGPRSAANLVFAEADLQEMLLYARPGQDRQYSVFAEIATPSKLLVFDALVHEDVYPDAHPSLYIYDTAHDGSADVNDPARDIDRLDTAESVQFLGKGVSRFRTADVAYYADMLNMVCAKRGWDGNKFRGYRCRIDYPIYGSQVAMSFTPPPPTTTSAAST